jgi:hypothetical protein
MEGHQGGDKGTDNIAATTGKNYMVSLLLYCYSALNRKWVTVKRHNPLKTLEPGSGLEPPTY